MNIAIFTNNYLPNPYGLTQSIESFRRQFEKRGHLVYIFAPKAKGYVDQNSNVFRYPSIDINYKISYPLALPYSPKIEKIISSLNLDIIHSQHHVLLGAAAVRWAKRKNIPLVFTWHTLFNHYVHFVPLIPPKWAAEWIIKKAVKYANQTDCVIAPTDSAQEIIRKWGVENKNIVSIPSGIDEQNFINPRGDLVRKKYGIGKDEKLLLFVCRLTKEKNVNFLFQAVFRVLRAKIKCKFMVVGGGDLKNSLKKMVEKNGLAPRVIFTGVIERDEIKNYFAAGDIFVYASKSETQGMIMSEALYMGLPIVAIRATGASDLVENGVTGFLTSEDVGEFSDAVMRLLNNENLKNNLSKNSAKVAREKYTDSICASKMLETYEAIINNKKAASDKIFNI